MPSKAGSLHGKRHGLRVCFQDPFERSNTYWDWNLNHVGGAYGMMDEVFKFIATFKEFPPRSFPPSFNPANILEENIRDMREERRRGAELQKK